MYTCVCVTVCVCVRIYNIIVHELAEKPAENPRESQTCTPVKVKASTAHQAPRTRIVFQFFSCPLAVVAPLKLGLYLGCGCLPS